MQRIQAVFGRVPSTSLASRGCLRLSYCRFVDVVRVSITRQARSGILLGVLFVTPTAASPANDHPLILHALKKSGDEILSLRLDNHISVASSRGASERKTSPRRLSDSTNIGPLALLRAANIDSLSGGGGGTVLSSVISEHGRPVLAYATLSIYDPKSTLDARVGERYNLDRLVAIAVTNHPSVLSKRAELDVAQSGIEVERWGFFPSPSIRKEAANTSQFAATTVVSVQQPLWTGGRLTAGLDAAASRTNAADAAVVATQHDLALRIVSAYRSWLVACGRSEVFEKAVVLLDSYAEGLRRRIEGGVSAESDLELVVSRLSQVKSDLVAARSAERSALAQLSQMVGVTLSRNHLERPQETTTSLQGIDAVIHEATARSPLLRRLGHDIVTAQHEVDIKRSSLWPAVNLRAERQIVDSSSPGAISGNRIMVLLEYAPGAGLSASAASDAAAAKVIGLREARESARRELVEIISADYETYLASRMQGESLQRTLKASANVMSSYHRLFVAGRRSWLDVMNAAREVTQIEASLVEVEASLAVSSFRLRLYQGQLPWLAGRDT